jgi:NTP pyrophosphatase (non-canonical NTP hydrolase)
MPFTTYEQAATAIMAFRDERNWKQFHNPHDLALNLICEAAELANIWLWLQGDQIAAQSSKKREQIGEELADVFYSLVLMADCLKTDPYEKLSRLFPVRRWSSDFNAMCVIIQGFCPDYPESREKHLTAQMIKETSRVLEYAAAIDPEWPHGIDASTRMLSARLSDLLELIMCLAGTLELNLLDEVERKLAKNAVRYPVERARGCNSRAKDYED